MPWPSGGGMVAGQMRRLVRDLRTEASGPTREAVAVGVGVFIGALPVYGFHLVMCLAVGWLFRLNRLKLYVAANISNPFMAPFLVFSELQTGAFIRRGEFLSITLEAIRSIGLGSLGLDLLVGSLFVGTVLGLAIGGTTWWLTRDGSADALFAELVRRASDRFVSTSIVAWEFARGKLRGDPIYRTMLFEGALGTASHGTLVDVGCGSGLTLALLAEAAAAWRGGRWPDDRPAPPRFDRLVGVERRPRVARLAQSALGDAATIVAADARTAAPEDCSAMLFFDVLHMMPHADQERLLASVLARLSSSAVVLVREADAAAGWRFRAVQAGNTVKALVFGQWDQRFTFRTAAEWTALFERLGFVVTRQTMGAGTPFANVLFLLTFAPRASA